MTTHKAIREALEAGPTEGPWEWDGNVCNYDPENEAPWLVQAPWHAKGRKRVLTGSIMCDRESDAAFIAACNPAAIRALLADLDAMRVALEHCEGVFMSHEINHINGGKIEDDALAIIRAALKGTP